MAHGLREISVVGTVSRSLEEYTLVTDEGSTYRLSAIAPWEAVAPDYGSQAFAQHAGERMVAHGLTDGSTIWKASLSLPSHSN